jgi:hypothetical protein
VVEERLGEGAPGQQRLEEVSDDGGVLLDGGQLAQHVARSGGGQRARLCLPDDPEHVLVALGAQRLLGAEVVDDEAGAHARLRRDDAQRHAEAVEAEPADGGVADAGASGEVRLRAGR